MSLFNLAGRILDKKFDDAARAHAPKLDRVDTGLPFNAQIGALLEVPRAEFALLDASLLTVPATAQLPIVAVSRIHLDADDSLALYRLYTSTGRDRSGDGASFLQVVCRAGRVDDIQDLAYYQHVCRDYPVTDEEQAPYRGEGFGLGEPEYNLADDKLRQIPHVAADLRAYIATDNDALVFTRDTPGGDYVAPFGAVENRLDDAVGEKGSKRRLSFMPYTRELAGGQQERLLISFDYVKSMDGRADPTAYVDFLAGLALDRNKVKVL
jgi:hypothetical protein